MVWAGHRLTYLVCGLDPFVALDIEIHPLLRIASIHENGSSSRLVDAEEVILI